MRFFYPRAELAITAYVNTSRTGTSFEVVEFRAVPRSVTIERNSYNEADECKIEFSAARFPVLPRSVRQVLIRVYAGDVGGLYGEAASLIEPEFLRFIGYVDDPELSLDESDGKIGWKARDFTALLLDTKRPSVKIVPSYGDRLDRALRRILDDLPGGEAIDLVYENGATSWPDLSAAAPAGWANKQMPAKPEDTAWDLIKRACDPLGLIPQIKLDKLHVSSSRGLENPTRRPVFIWGQNLLEYKEKRNLRRLREGIGLNGYDLSRRKYITALWPPEGDRAVVAHLKPATKKGGKPKPQLIAGSNEKRKWFPFGAVANQKALDEAARRIFEVRRAQEFEGSFKCARMVVPSQDQIDDGFEAEIGQFDVTGLSSGDRVMLDVRSDEKTLLGRLSTTEARARYLVDQGYGEAAARALARVFDSGVEGPLEVYVHKASHKFTEADYSLEVEFKNLISGAPNG